ncbi:choice-of-anchor V domain-containing protein [Candidatus Neomarinimicrobiota bacterium]
MKTVERLVHVFPVLALMTGVAGGMFYGKGPPPAATNAPGEGACQTGRCHVQYQLNSGPGTLNTAGIPNTYQPSERYPLAISLAQEGQKRWGFQLTVLDSTHQPAGELILSDEQLTQKKAEIMPDKSERQYIEHTVEGTYPGITNGPVTWKVIWQAPSKDTGPVFFYTVANAANSNKKPWGDYIYTRIDTALLSPPE